MSLKRIDEIFHFEKGVLQSSKCIPGDYNFITASSDWKTHNEYTHECEALIFAAAASGSLGRTHYVSGKFVSSDLCFILTPKDSENFPIDLRFYHILFNELKDEIVRNTKAGTSKEAIGLGSFGKYKLPYFDIDKQIEIKNRFVNSEGTKEELSTELTHQLTLVKKLRQQLLQDAVQGKLMPQNPSDEPASELLKKIKAEKQKLIAEGKLKKEKELPLIKAEEIPFEIPEGWVWCRLGEIIYDTEGGKSPNCLHEPAKDDEWGVIKTTAVQELYFFENENKVLPKNFVISEQHKVLEGDILITRAGPKNRVGIVCCVENLTKNLILSDKTIRIKHNKTLLYSKYIALSLNSPLIKPLIEQKMTGMADSQVNISQDNMKGFLIPLPPLAEQTIIVEKYGKLLQTCDSLEASIKESAEQNEKLLQQLLREALRKEAV